MSGTSNVRATATLLAWLLGSLLLASSCAKQGEPSGGETHFLRQCSSDAQCDLGSSCVCGVCSLTCFDREDCSATLSAADCVTVTEVQACGAAVPAGRCDVRCVFDVDCSVVSPAHSCRAGACRAGEPGCAPSGVTGNDVLLLGDSFFGATHQVTAYLEEFARADGVLAPGGRYRDNSTPIDNALALGENGIQAQFERALREAPVRVVIMNGGGGDVLPSRCAEPLADCPEVVNAVAAAEQLFARMAGVGVEHVLYAFYPDPTDATLRARIDALRPLVQAACAASAVPCHWLDLRPAFAGHGEYIAADGINPTASGARAAATAIWSALRQACIGQ